MHLANSRWFPLNWCCSVTSHISTFISPVALCWLRNRLVNILLVFIIGFSTCLSCSRCSQISESTSIPRSHIAYSCTPHIEIVLKLLLTLLISSLLLDCLTLSLWSRTHTCLPFRFSLSFRLFFWAWRNDFGTPSLNEDNATWRFLWSNQIVSLLSLSQVNWTDHLVLLEILRIRAHVDTVDANRNDRVAFLQPRLLKPSLSLCLALFLYLDNFLLKWLHHSLFVTFIYGTLTLTEQCMQMLILCILDASVFLLQILFILYSDLMSLVLHQINQCNCLFLPYRVKEDPKLTPSLDILLHLVDHLCANKGVHSRLL